MKSSIRFLITTTLTTGFIHSLSANDEIIVASSPFTVEREITGICVPTKTQAVLLKPEAWESFEITSLSSYGAKVAEGDTIITFNADPLEKAILTKKSSVAEKELKLAIANRKLAELEQKNALSLAQAKTSLENAENDLNYFNETQLPQREKELDQQIVRAQDYLRYSKEELDQLQKMYEEDDLTEETEEIILVRQKAAVRDAEFNLAKEKLSVSRKREAGLPRELVTLQNKVTETQIAYATAKLNLERELALEKLNTEKLTRELADSQEELADLEADLSLCEIKAEFAGNIIYGEISNGEYKVGKLGETLRPGGKAPLNKGILTVIAQDSPLTLQALLPSEEVTEITTAIEEGAAKTSEPEETERNKGAEITYAPFPNAAGQHLVTLPLPQPEPMTFPAQKTSTTITFYTKESAITLPIKAIAYEENDDKTPYVMVRQTEGCLLYTSPSPRDQRGSRMPSSA